MVRLITVLGIPWRARPRSIVEPTNPCPIIRALIRWGPMEPENTARGLRAQPCRNTIRDGSCKSDTWRDMSTKRGAPDFSGAPLAPLARAYQGNGTTVPEVGVVPGNMPTAAIVDASPLLDENEKLPPTPGMMLELLWSGPPLPAAEASATAAMPPVDDVELVTAKASDCELSGPVGLTLVWARAKPQPTPIRQPPATLMPLPVPLAAAVSLARVWLLAVEPLEALETDSALAPA